MEVSFRDAQVAVVGLGLMGGSLCAALHTRGSCREVIGVARRPATLEMARDLRFIDRGATDLAEGLRDADVVVLATPVRDILDKLATIGTMLKPGCLVTDLGSTKVAICRAMAQLPERIQPLGGHPMCGKETASADGGIFHGAPFAFCRLERSSPRAVGFAVALCEALNAHAVWLPAEVHDRQVAATSHLPYLVANALAAATPLDAAPLVGPGFRSAARLAGSPPEMILDILLTNRVQILDSARRFQAAFESLVSALEDPGDPGSVDLRERLQSGRQKRSDLLRLEEQL